LIAQRDNKDSLAMAELQTELARIQTAIANTTKEDSYAMGIIAVMSIVLLPGTFVSSFFSMDMFDWQAPKGASVVSFRF
jgi:Mg2+ and Co2+ transporter CorA